MGQYFHFIFEILRHGITRSHSPVPTLSAGPLLMFFSLNSISFCLFFRSNSPALTLASTYARQRWPTINFFFREQHFFFLIFPQYGKSRKDPFLPHPKVRAYQSELSFRYSSNWEGSWPYPQTLDQAGKACQKQTFQLLTKIRKLRTKKVL